MYGLMAVDLDRIRCTRLRTFALCQVAVLLNQSTALGPNATPNDTWTLVAVGAYFRIEVT